MLKKTDYDTKIEDIEKKTLNHDKFIINNNSNKFSDKRFDKKLKRAKLTTNNDINIRYEKKKQKQKQKIAHI